MHTRPMMKVSEKDVEVEKVHMIHLELLQQQTPGLTIRLYTLPKMLRILLPLSSQWMNMHRDHAGTQS